ncbi:MAG TPA: AMP-binding protein [Kofleriaceae bacterium]|jgi:acyl-CoA synthetase (AMP-forming)/AMP-acid ligase II
MRNFASWLLETGAPDARAVWDEGRWWTFAELGVRTRQVAAALTTRGARGKIVLLCGENSAEGIAAYLGALYAGAVAAPLLQLGDASLAAFVRDTGATIAIARAEHQPQLRMAGLDVLVVDEPLTVQASEPAAVDVNELAVVLYTSGSTGTPRGVMLSSDNLRYSTEAILSFAPLTADDRALASLPFYYCYGLSVLHTHVRAGAAVVIASSAMPGDLVALAEATGVTGLLGVPTMFQILVPRGLRDRTLPAVRYAMLSGGKATPRLITELRAALPHARVYLRYGITEVTAAASCLAPELVDSKPDSIGRGLADAPLTVERPDGVAVAPGSDEVGEVVVRGRHVGLGYLGAPEETARCFRDGAFYTGDRARVDADGDVYLVGRDREFIKTGGHRVSPQEVEDVVAAIPEVAEAAVVGVPHQIRGEALVAIVVLQPGATLDLRGLSKYCGARMAPWKVPTELRVVEALPKRDNGKIDRRALGTLSSARVAASAEIIQPGRESEEVDP